MPSAKYSVGIQAQGDFDLTPNWELKFVLFSLFFMYIKIEAFSIYE